MMVVRVVGDPSAASDSAVERYFKQFLERENSAAVWDVRERPQDRRVLEAAPREVRRPGAGEEHDDLGGIAA
jgi:hypothetical protein